MNINKTPRLIEPSTKLFMQQKLQLCHTTRYNIYSAIINISIIIIFLGGILITLYIIYKNRPSEEEKKQKELESQIIILEKCNQLRKIPER